MRWMCLVRLQFKDSSTPFADSMSTKAQHEAAPRPRPLRHMRQRGRKDPYQTFFADITLHAGGITFIPGAVSLMLH